MKVKYTIKSIKFYKQRLDDDGVKIEWCTISQNVDCIMNRIKKSGLTMLKTCINQDDSKWTFTLKGCRGALELFQEWLFAQGAKVYNISYHKTSWFD